MPTDEEPIKIICGDKRLGYKLCPSCQAQLTLLQNLSKQKTNKLDELNDQMLKEEWTPEQLLAIQHTFVRIKTQMEKL